jgi:hypothetical protein
MLRFLLIAPMTALVVGGCSPRVRTMKEPTEHDPWVIRTDFSSDAQWKTVRELIAAPQKDAGREFFAYVRYVSDDNYQDKQPNDLVLSLPDKYPQFFCFVVDAECIEKPEHPVLVVGFYPSDNESFGRSPRETTAGDIRSFRAVPSQIQGIENNLSIANMDFEEFARAVDKDGVFRGFHR